jgi:integrase/recombinase XerD
MLAETGTSNIMINATLQGLRMLYCHTLKRPKVMPKTPTLPEPHKLTNVLGVQEVKRLMIATTSVKYRQHYRLPMVLECELLKSSI